LEFFQAGSQDRAAMQIFEIPLAADGVDPLAYGVGHLAESGVEAVQDRLAGGLEDAFLEPLTLTPKRALTLRFNHAIFRHHERRRSH
jgi:hypothetical protein